jgi:hypothetical protein
VENNKNLEETALQHEIFLLFKIFLPFQNLFCIKTALLFRYLFCIRQRYFPPQEALICPSIFPAIPTLFFYNIFGQEADGV